ncbi:MAG: Kdo hydroxylase family protein [Burkholderiales bacterium]
MTPVITLSVDSWNPSCTPEDQDLATRALEAGGVLFMPDLVFALQDDERDFLSPDTAGEGKNVSFDGARNRLSGSSADAASQRRLQAMLARYAVASRSLLQGLLPHYAPTLQQARTSFRPVEIAGRDISWRKDDTRLHVDSFPSSPTGGDRILRVFSNVNPNGQSRAWRLGESFEAVSRRFLPQIRGPLPGANQVLKAVGVTKRLRSDYDHFMLGLHDRMKADLAYQANADQSDVGFPPGSSWIVYTDQVSHAAMGGQHAFEQTFHLPVAGMFDPAQAPLGVLERLVGRTLVWNR